MDVEKKLYVGIVEENIDPRKQGRIKVRVQTLYHEISTEDIPWAAPFATLAGKAFEVPAIGKLVNVLFFQNDLYDPYYIFSENYNINLQNKLKDLSDDEYIRFIALLFDDRTQIFADSNELTLDHYFNKITITKWGINHELKDNKQLLNLGSKSADQEAVLGTRYFEWMDRFIAEIAKPSSFIGNLGAPVLKAKINQLCVEYQTLRKDFVSKHVKIVDNDKVSTLERDTVPYQHDMDLDIPVDGMSPEIRDKINQQTKSACGNISESSPSGGVGEIPEELPEPTGNSVVFTVKRYKFMDDRTIGKLYLNDGTGEKFVCDTLEDKVRDFKTEKKIKGETAIPYGIYKLTVGPTGLSRQTAPTGRLPLVNDVPYFEGIRIHKWGKPKDTQGCLLVGNIDDTTNTLTNYDIIAAKVLLVCESYSKKGIKMTIAYTKDENVQEIKTNTNNYGGSSYVQKNDGDPTAEGDSSCIKGKPDSSWTDNLELQDFKLNGETLDYSGKEYIVTLDQLKYIMPRATNDNLKRFLIPINITLEKFGINTPLRIAAFLSQIAHESGSLLYTEELASGIKYEGRKDLGNTKKGDGVKYKGRGLIQITGRANYEEVSKSLGMDFVEQPELLKTTVWAALSAGLWWNKRSNKLNIAADSRDIKRITKIVNGGTNGLAERTQYYNRALKTFNLA